MRITKEQPTFTPITIVLETEDDLDFIDVVTHKAWVAATNGSGEEMRVNDFRNSLGLRQK